MYSNILDKPTESMFGYIGVLVSKKKSLHLQFILYYPMQPGAFSAYRYIALQNDKTTGKGPLASYFKGEVLHGRETDIFTSNMCKIILQCHIIGTKNYAQTLLKTVFCPLSSSRKPTRIGS
jgi:chitin synthase